MTNIQALPTKIQSFATVPLERICSQINYSQQFVLLNIYVFQCSFGCDVNILSC